MDLQVSLAQQGEDEGITAEERRAIIADIDEVAGRNRISGEVSRAAPVPSRKGFVFPLVVNVLALAFTAGVIVFLALFFRQKDQVTAEGNAVVTTAEGKLIQEIKREADSKLQEKEKAIAEIQDRLASIDKQRSELASSIDQKIKEREAELRAALKAELDRERARLAEQGLSEAAIKERIEKYTAQKTAELNRQMDDYKKKVDSERAAEEARLAQARDEYQRNIQGLNDERKKILDDAKQSEARLRAALDVRAKELEGQTAAAQAGLAKAQSELALLQDQRSKSQAAEERILGLYDTIRAALRERRFNDAVASIATLRSYLSDPSLAAIPSLKGRRDADLFIAEALDSLAKGELERSSVDVTKLLGQAELLASVRQDSADGAKALKEGDAATAAGKYRAVLAAVPEILAAHDYFMAAQRDAEAADDAKLKAALEEAERTWKAGNRSETAHRYAEALAMLPIDDAQKGAMIARLAQMGGGSSSDAARASDTAAARSGYMEAQRDLGAGKWPEAIGLFIGVVGSYPAAEQAPEALKGIDAARAGMEKDFAARSAAYEKTIADLRASASRADANVQAQGAKADQATIDQRLADSDAKRAAAEKSLADAQQQLKASQADVARLQKQLDAVAAATAAASARSGAVSAEAAAAAAAASADTKALADLRAHAKALQQEYSDYLAAEGAAAGKGGNLAIVDSQKRLVAFLGGPEVKALFPDLAGIVDRQYSSYSQQISLETLRTAADIAIQAATARSAKEKQASLDANAKHYAGDKTISDFIGVLRDLLK